MRHCKILLVLSACALLFGAAAAQPGSKWPPKSMDRPRPEVVTPGESPMAPPSDAIVLFDGSNLDAWEMDKKDQSGIPAVWTVENGYMEVPKKAGGIRTRREFGDFQFHVEWATPSEVSGNGQGRGNSGIMLKGLCEVQVLDSYDNDTYPDGQAGALYLKFPPLVNASRKAGEWQRYDIIFNAARDDGPAKLTVIHNGVVIHHAADPGSRTQKLRIGLQDHNNPMRFRNVWIRELSGYPE